jgi:hypothetical protein
MMKNFGLAEAKQEGASVPFDTKIHGTNQTHSPLTCYVERRVPKALEAEAHAVIDAWLASKGFGPEVR